MEFPQPAQINTFADPQTVCNLIEHDRLNHAPEYGGYLSNHSMHAIVALYYLGGTQDVKYLIFSDRFWYFLRADLEHFQPTATDNDLKSWYKKYSRKLEKLQPEKDPRHPISTKNWKSHLGDLSYYSDYRTFFQGEYSRLGLNQMIQTYFVHLFPAMACAALHPLITIGFALYLGHSESVCDGMAYLCGVYFEIDSDAIEKDKVTIPSSFENTSCDSLWEVLEQLRSEHDIWDSLHTTHGFTSRLKSISTDERKKRSLKQAFSKMMEILLPNTKSTSELLETLGKFTMECYFKNGCQNFFLLHTISGFHALRRILNEFDREDDRFLILKCWSYVLLCVYVLQQRPAMDVYGAKQLEAVDATATESSWTNIINQTKKYDDEHVIKLVWIAKWNWNNQICKMLSAQASKELGESDTTLDTLPGDESKDLSKELTDELFNDSEHKIVSGGENSDLLLYKSVAFYTLQNVASNGDGWQF